MKALGAIAVVVLLLAGVYLIMPDAFQGLWETPGTGTTTATSTPQGSEATYESAAYAVSFEYPASYTLREDDTEFQGTDVHVISLADTEALENAPQNGEGPPAITLSISSTTATSTESWIRNSELSNFALSSDESFGTTTVGGVQALTYRSDGLYATDNVVLLRAGRAYHFSVGWITENDAIIEDFDQLLSTVELR